MSRSLKEKAKLQMQGKLGILILITFLPAFILGALSVSFVGTLLALPITVGTAFALIQVSKGGPGELKDLFRSLEGNYYLMHLWTLLKVGIFTFLWTLLLIIPGIIKVYSYYLTPYILADTPDETDAITKSMQMMNGHKLELFFLQFSFIGWALLSAITFGLVWIFYAGPYYNQTMALYYLALKESH
jgi:uncharacterized membrane protein